MVQELKGKKYTIKYFSQFFQIQVLKMFSFILVMF